MTPSEAPAPTMVTLDDLRNKILNNYYDYTTDSQKLSISTSSSPSASMLTLGSII
jgi:hypothetical protein